MKRKQAGSILLLSLIYLILCVLSCQAGPVKSGRSFTIDYDNNQFLKDGKPYRYVSGSFHYSRVPRPYWKDRMLKMRAAGLNALQTVVVWNVHEPQPGMYDFEGQNDLVAFLQTAQEVGLDVLLRGGPYICAEWEYGGLPPWILKQNASIVPRSYDPGFIEPCDRWFSVFLPMMKPFLWKNGGPIIMVQIENEYGSYFACDQEYMQYLRQTFLKYLGEDTVLYTTDGAAPTYLRCGPTKGVYTTVDFGVTGSSPAPYFEVQRTKEPKGPLVNSEYYTGWLDWWGHPHQTRPAAPMANYLGLMLNMTANVNMYMFTGGTMFGFYNGADPGWNICPTSYDYDAPISEAGDTGEKLLAIREVVSKYLPLPSGPVPPNMPKYAYGTIGMKKLGSVFDLLNTIAPSSPVKSTYPLSQEQIGQNYGYTLYRHVFTNKYADRQLATKDGIRDRAYVMIDQMPVGVLDRAGAMGLQLPLATPGQILDIVVENQGRINFGSFLNQTKGIISNVTMGGVVLENWEIYPLNFSKAAGLNSDTLKYTRSMVYSGVQDVPTAYIGTFQAPNKPGFPQDTFLQPMGWIKGQVYVNGVNIGRYWPNKGPQVTLYVPACYLKAYPAQNTVIMLELEKSPCSTASLQQGCTVEFVDKPILNATIATQDPVQHSQFQDFMKMKLNYD